MQSTDLSTEDELFPYQRDAVEWLSQKHSALLALDMGLGKTAVSITAANKIEAQSILILCPAAATENWCREWLRWTTTNYTAMVDVFSYGSLHKIPEGKTWDLAILDESHFLKSPDAQRTKAVFGKTGLLHRVKRAWCLSGTPAPNHAAELWPMLYAFGLTKLSYEAFIDRYCVTWQFKIGQGFRRPQIRGNKAEHMAELRTVLHPLMYRKLKEEVMKDLPPIYFEDIVVTANEVDLEVESSFVQYVTPTDRRAELFAKLEAERDLLKSLIKKTGLGNDGVHTLEAVANSISTLRRYTGLQKTEAVAELVADELESWAYDKVVLFAIHRDVIEKLRERLARFGVVTLYGGTVPDKRQRNVDKFQTNKKCRVFIGNIQSAGTAITLTAAHNVVFVEQDWVPGNNAQAAMRCHRIGQEKPVYVRFVGLAKSMDQQIAQVLKRKARDIARLIDNA